MQNIPYLSKHQIQRISSYVNSIRERTVILENATF